MKNNKISFLLRIIASMLLLISCRSTPKQNDIVVFNAAIPDYQSKPVKTYQASDKNAIDENTAVNNVKQLLTAMGEQNNFDFTNKVNDEGRLYFVNKQDPSASCFINLKNGDISANAGSKNYLTNNSTPGLLKKDDAVSMANKYLQQLKYADFKDASLTLGHTGGVNMGMHNDQNKTEVYEKFTTVRYNRTIDGLPVLGHSRFVVQLAEQGKLHGVIRQWQTFNGSPVEKEAEVNPDDVKKSISDHLISENKNAKHIIVDQINLVYYESMGMTEPALHVICKVQLPKSKTDTALMTFPYDIVEPILKNPKMVYTYMAQSHKDQPKNADEVNTKEPPKHGDDERK